MRFVKFLSFFMLIAVQASDLCAATASRSLFSRAIAPVRSFASAHPRLTKAAKIAAITGGALWLLDRIINRPVHVPQVPVYCEEPAQQAAGCLPTSPIRAFWLGALRRTGRGCERESRARQASGTPTRATFDNDQAVAPACQAQENDQKRETAFLFAHGLGGDCEHVNGHIEQGVVGDLPPRFQNSGNGEESQGSDSSCCAVNFPDARRTSDGNLSHGSAITVRDWFVFRRQFLRSSIGQEADIACLQKTYEDYVHMGGKNKNIVLYGASRGASTIINFMARSKLNSVKALILESPLDSVQNHVGEILGKLNYVPGLNWFCHHFIVPGVYRKYNPRGAQPLDVVDKIQPDVPVLFVCSKTELFYPATVRLYKKLARSRGAQGRNNVHLLVLESGQHCNLLYDPHCGELYRDVVYAFYDKYGLKKPQISRYYPEGVRRGKQIFEAMSQPDPETLPF